MKHTFYLVWFFVFFCVLCARSEAAIVSEWLSLPNVKVGMGGYSSGETVTATAQIYTPNTISAVRTSFHTFPENTREWYFLLSVSGILNEELPVAPYSNLTEVFHDDLVMRREMDLFSTPFEENCFLASFSLRPSEILSGTIRYDEEFDEDDPAIKYFDVSIEVRGQFADPSYGKMFIVPEPNVLGLLIFAIIGRRWGLRHGGRRFLLE